MNRTIVAAAFALCTLIAIQPGSSAHPMGNFSICHYAAITAGQNELKVRYIVDFAEIPTVGEAGSVELASALTTSESGRQRLLNQKADSLVKGIQILVDGKPTEIRRTNAEIKVIPGAGGLNTFQISMDLNAPLGRSLPSTIEYHDTNYTSRAGWKEVVVRPESGCVLTQSTAPTTDRSRGLSIYPTDSAPPNQTEASFTVSAAGAVAGPVTPSNVKQLPAKSNPANRDAFTETIASKNLTPGIIAFGLLVAFVFGAFHALSPGHGKAMVAAYLVGARGTPRDAVILGITVTITHTLGVFALGLLTLAASQYIVPEILYSWLSIISGVAVCAVGLWLLYSRTRGVEHSHTHHDHDHPHTHDHVHPDKHVHTHDHDHPHTHDHDHPHTHDHGDGHDHDHPQMHDHGDGRFHHHHLPDKVTVRSLIVLGISGGLVPCPTALVVLLAAVALHRVLFGLALITAFSIGLAAILVVIGLVIVWARPLAEKIPSSGKLLKRLPVASAAMVTMVGILLIVRAVYGQ
ncbi:MAG: sulfite exporter TauE/SafE family protein [Chthonomonadales bacterium]